MRETITHEMIETAKKTTKYSSDEPKKCHEHDDCIRIAYQFLDAQLTGTFKPKWWSAHIPLKHIIEYWAGRYVSQDDVDVAAELHPAISGTYPFYNFAGKGLILPRRYRLASIRQAGTQPRYLSKDNLEEYFSSLEQFRAEINNYCRTKRQP